jgi:signal transduction histidine kinase
LRLADFILRDIEEILTEWEQFARAQLPAASELDSAALRDHAEHILRAIVTDISTAQSPEQEVQKSTSSTARPRAAPETAAETHALIRAKDGFEIKQMVAEYRALRASVLRLWAKACEPSAGDPQEMIRFNEAIDQAIVESVSYFNGQVDNDRNLMLGMLGHDMRNPLNVAKLSAKYFQTLSLDDVHSAAISRLSRSVDLMSSLLDDLLDFNRTKLGLGIIISPSTINLADVFAVELDQLRAAHSERQIEFYSSGELTAVLDANRLRRLLGNLVLNALEHGTPNSPVHVRLTGLETEIVITVQNRGPVIEPSMLGEIFQPLKRGREHGNDSGKDGGMGLGLHIAREIARAHGGNIFAQSDASQTVFAVRLPKSRTTNGAKGR